MMFFQSNCSYGIIFHSTLIILYLNKNISSSFKIINIDAELSGSNHYNLKEIENNQNYKYVKGNINNKKIIEKLVSRNDVVFNFAAESHVDRSITNAKPFIDSNILGVFTILESI